eukprot:13537093-Ditylum_brightwellii.AAC.1
MKQFFTENGTTVEAAPPHHQRQNVLAERHWRTLVRMAHSWINSALLPSSFWYVALAPAATVSNYLPVCLKGQLTAPFEIVHHEKYDIRNLFPMFSVAYVKKIQDDKVKHKTFQ